MSRRLILLSLAALVVAVPACEYDLVVPTPPRLPSPAPAPTVEITTLTLHNGSRETICVIYASPVTSETYGDNLLGDETAAPGDTRAFDLLADTYVLRAYDCDGNELVTQEDVALHQPTEWELNDAILAGGLNLEGPPRFGETDLSPSFAPDPHAVDLAAGGEVEVALLELGADCTGFASSAPDYRVTWWGDSGDLRIFFVAEGGEETALIAGDPDENWLCNDDFDDGPAPMIEVRSAVSGQYDIWVGSHASGESIEGTLYITAKNYGPGNLP